MVVFIESGTEYEVDTWKRVLIMICYNDLAHIRDGAHDVLARAFTKADQKWQMLHCALPGGILSKEDMW